MSEDSESVTPRRDRVMVDIETLGLEPGAAILSIGAVRFDRDGLGDTFEASVSLTSCEEAGLKIDAGTLEWWLGQEDAAREQLVGGDDLGTVLSRFGVWYREQDADEIWANSPSFDCEHLERAFDAVGVNAPWEFRDERCYRTLRSLTDADEDVAWDGVEHDALDDAKYQATVAMRALAQLEGNDGE